MTARLLTAAEVAQKFAITQASVYRLTREGVLPAVRLGRRYRYDPAALDEFVRGQRREA
jgi:excisionase family DNA binding protein